MLKSTKKLPFEGCATALVTPFKNGELDLDAFSRLVEAQIKAGVGALVVCGDKFAYTDETGRARFMMHDGEYNVYVVCDGKTATADVSVSGAAVNKTVTLQ